MVIKDIKELGMLSERPREDMFTRITYCLEVLVLYGLINDADERLIRDRLKARIEKIIPPKAPKKAKP